MNQLDKKIRTAEFELDALYVQRREARGRKMIPCSKCGRRSRVRKLVYYAWMWYTRPYSCTGGDYWSEGEGHFVCPHCTTVNRTYQREWIAELQPHFARTVKVYEERSCGYFNNQQTLELFAKAALQEG